MPTYYLIPYRNGTKIGKEEDIYPLLLDDDRAIYPEKLKQWTVEIHCGNTRMKCVACQKYIHDNVKFASLSLYLMYDADTHILSHNTNYHPFTGLSYRNNDDEDMISLPREFTLPLHEGMFLSFNLPANSRRWCYSMDFYVGAFEEEEEEGFDTDIDVDDDDDMVDNEEECEDNNRSVVLLSDDDDGDDAPPQLINHIVSMAVAVQPSLNPRPPPTVPEAAFITSIGVDDNATPLRPPDPSGGTPFNFSSPPPTRLGSHHMFSTTDDIATVSTTDDIATVRAELAATHTQLQAALARNALLSPFAKGYLPLNSPSP
ncbi:hypothetical protein FRACYDRAFT_247805 [Fragilariopsis cylindrus CCMP1102]|uniref:Uncharacterized protein n=1 Tax=Fragilariopsis cylindrus CCMP1102 TaxID=635003 RepID=A0A1E7EVY4_9STRA|nr:hypothetical protein FRACYDRAFT_247805 [Fragilariopsis cylindrus CCMP1102]|eukprot:OEU10188.1 hypothetical protein FRACYDRAFT_247805 [Fragilariopsis cylindrus CCMP1102]